MQIFLHAFLGLQRGPTAHRPVPTEPGLGTGGRRDGAQIGANGTVTNGAVNFAQTCVNQTGTNGAVTNGAVNFAQICVIFAKMISQICANLCKFGANFAHIRPILRKFSQICMFPMLFDLHHRLLHPRLFRSNSWPRLRKSRALGQTARSGPLWVDARMAGPVYYWDVGRAC